jgi:hypothetical protein
MEGSMSLAVRLLGVGVVTALYLWNTTVGIAALSAVFGYALAQRTWKGAAPGHSNN